MTFKKVLSQDPTGKVTKIYHEDDEGNIAIQSIRDETAVIEDNKAIHNMWTSLDRWGDGKVCLREVPIPLLNEWKARGWFTKELFYKCLLDERSAPYKVFGK